MTDRKTFSLVVWKWPVPEQLEEIMLLQAFLLFIAVPAFLADEAPFVRIQPEKHFTASSSYNDTFKAPNVRFMRNEFRTSDTRSEEPWCPAHRADNDYSKEYVTVDLGCPRTVRSVKAKDRYLQGYSSTYSNDKKHWKTLAFDYETEFGVKVINTNYEKLITPSVRARFFRFRPVIYRDSPERGFQPCMKAELYGESDPEDSVQPMGCKKRLLPVVYHTVQASINKKFPDILGIYEECRQKAAEFSKPLEIFGIKNYNKCVTTKTGKAEDYFQNVETESRHHCKVCFGKGIGARESAAFLYKMNLKPKLPSD